MGRKAVLIGDILSELESMTVAELEDLYEDLTGGEEEVEEEAVEGESD